MTTTHHQTGGTRARQTRIQPATIGATTQPVPTGLGGSKADPPTWDVAKASWDKGRVNPLGSHKAGECSSVQTACGKQSEIYRHIWSKPADTEGRPENVGENSDLGDFPPSAETTQAAKKLPELVGF